MMQRIRLLCTMLLLSAAGGSAMAIEEAAFDVVEQADGFEIRQYHDSVVAETFAEGDMDAASNRGFRTIADYIFGNNRAARPDAPAGGEKIAMTAPVTVEPEAGAADFTAARRWRIQFVMPARYSLATLPRPVNPEVRLRAAPGRRFAVSVFAGLAWQSSVREHTASLLAWTAARGLKVVGTPQLARYNPPWTLPFWRRNEILVEVETTP